MTKRIVLCADDYGQAPSISRAIRTLINSGRITATTCVVNTPCWLEHASWLATFSHYIDVGLHINLTQGKALSRAFIDRYGEALFPIPILLRKIMLRQLDNEVIAAECETQLQQFSEALGILPAFIDCHQRIHQFPVIRQILLQLYERHLRSQNTYIRLVGGYMEPGSMMGGFKQIVVHALGTKPLRDLLQKHEIPYKTSFAGILPADAVTEYRPLFLRCIKEVSVGGIIICHPGWYWENSPDVADKGAKARALQYEYLKGSQFLVDCHAQRIALSRLPEVEDAVLL